MYAPVISVFHWHLHFRALLSEKVSNGLRGVKSKVSVQKVDLFYTIIGKGHNHQEVMITTDLS